jgi:hypothetical protein
VLRHAKTVLAILGLIIATALVKGLSSIAFDYVWWLAVPLGIGILVFAVASGLKNDRSDATVEQAKTDGDVPEGRDPSL